MHAERGHTHVIVGDFFNASYPGSPWECPDWHDKPEEIRKFVEKILDFPAKDGKGFTPIIMMDGAPSGSPFPRIEQSYRAIVEALNGLIDNVILCPGWEPVVGAWTSDELNRALLLIRKLAPTALIAWHGSPRRWAGSSNPPEATDPWKGAEGGFYTQPGTGGVEIDIVLYQLEHEAQIYADANEDDEASSNYLNRWQDGIMRAGAGFHGWRIVKRIVAMETGAYEAFRKQRTEKDLEGIATRMKRVAEKHHVVIGYGNGLPKAA